MTHLETLDTGVGANAAQEVAARNRESVRRGAMVDLLGFSVVLCKRSGYLLKEDLMYTRGNILPLPRDNSSLLLLLQITDLISSLPYLAINYRLCVKHIL